MLKVYLIKLKFILFFSFFLFSCKNEDVKKIKVFSNYQDLNQIKKYNLYLRGKLETKQKYDAACKLIRHNLRWLITSASTQNKEYTSALLANISSSCSSNFENSECAKKFYNYLHYLNSLCKIKNSEVANANDLFLNWMSVLREKWNEEFFKVTKKLLETSYKYETEIVLIGTLNDFFQIKSNENTTQRITLFLRVWGFSCPELTSEFSDKGSMLKSDRYLTPERCVPTCLKAKITEPLTDFKRRRAKVLKNCTPQDLGLNSKEDMKYLSLDNYIIFKSSEFLNFLFSDLLKSKSPFVMGNLKWIKKLKSKYESYKLYLSFADLSVEEEGYIDIPFSFSAYLLPSSKHYATIDSFGNMRLGERPLFSPFLMKVVSGTPYPGEKINALWEVVLDKWIKKIKDNPSVLLDSKSSLSLFLKIVKIIKNNGYDSIELIMKNQYNLLRSFKLKILEQLPSKYVLVHIGPGLMTVTSSFKVLKKDKYDSDSPYDFSGLRQRLERIRWRHPHKTNIVIKVEQGMSWSSLAKLIGYLTQNTSGRKLFENIGILLTDEQVQNKQNSK